MSVDGGFALEKLAALGSFFTLQTGIDEWSGWRPVTHCLDDTTEGRQIVGRLVDGVNTRLTASGPPIPPAKRWIAASVLQLGWAARLTSLYAGSMLLGASVPDLAATSLYYRELGPGRIELGVIDPVPVSAEMAWHRLYDDHLALLAAAIRRQVRIGQRLLDGNIASALVGAIETAARNQRATSLEAIVEQSWARPAAMATLGSWRSNSGGQRFVRTTCCGYEQLPQGSACGDCGLRKYANLNRF